MRELPLRDEEWVRNHLTLVRDNGYKLITNLQLLLPFSEVCRYDLLYQESYNIAYQELQGKLLFFKDKITGEIFKYKIIINNFTYFKEIFIEAYYNFGLDHQYFYWVDPTQYRLDIDQKEYNFHWSARSMVIDDFLKGNYNLDALKSSRKTVLHDYVVSKISEVNNAYEIIMGEILENDNIIKEDEFLNAIRENYTMKYKQEILEQLEKYKNAIDIKYALIRSDTRFSGTHKVIFNNYSGNRRRTSFDTIDIELNMLDDYDANLEFLKKNIKSVKSLIKKILMSNNKSKEYVNFLKMYSLVLSRENTLIARFCFKDGLEKLLTEEDKYEI